MQALILAGGQGTRLRPLTLTTPKPVVPLAGRPSLSFMLDWLADHGVDEAILSCGFLGDEVARVLGDRHNGLRLRYVNETEPLGTAGPLRLAVDEGGIDDRLVVLNGDVLTDFDLSAQIAFHERAGAAVTLALVAVDDPSSYGLVPTAATGEVEAFLEKLGGGPAGTPPPAGRVNAGAYVVERSVVERIPRGRPASFEREVFPDLVGAGLYGHAVEGYWIDIGTPERYLEATQDLLAGRVESTLGPRDDRGSLVLSGATTEGADIGPLSVVGDQCVVERGARVVRSVLHRGVIVGAGAAIEHAVLADGVTIGPGARVGPGAVLGAGARVDAEAEVPAGARIRPATPFALTGGGDRRAVSAATPAGDERDR